MTEAFESAVARSKEFTKRPSNEELLQLYALYKQATEGDVSGEILGVDNNTSNLTPPTDEQQEESSTPPPADPAEKVILP